eukprot:ctg_1869.g405
MSTPNSSDTGPSDAAAANATPSSQEPTPTTGAWVMPTSPGHGGGSASDASQLRLSSVPLSGTEAWALSSAGPSGRRPAAVTPHGTSSAVVSATPARLSSGRRELGEAPF